MSAVVDKSVADRQKAAMDNMICAISDTTEVNLESTYGKSSNYIVVYGNPVFSVLKTRNSRGELIDIDEMYNVNAANRQDGQSVSVFASVIKLSSGSIDVF